MADGLSLLLSIACILEDAPDVLCNGANVVIVVDGEAPWLTFAIVPAVATDAVR